MRPGRSREKILGVVNSTPKKLHPSGKGVFWKQFTSPGGDRLSRDKVSGKKVLSPTQVVSQFVRERHEVCSRQGSTDFKRFPHPPLSSEVLNGIVTRVYSRSRLEEFTRPDPMGLRLDLRSRINTIIEKEPTSKHCLQKRQKLSQGGKVLSRPSDTSKHSLGWGNNEPSDPGSNRKIDGQEDIPRQGRSRGKLLTIQDFPEEKILLRGLRAHCNSSQEKFKPKLFHPGSGSMLSRLSMEDFFPERYIPVARRDRAIIDNFSSNVQNPPKVLFGRKSSSIRS